MVNLTIVFLISLPFLWIWGLGLSWRLATIVIFFIYSLTFALFSENRCLGMMAAKTYWQKKFSLPQKLIYTILYTASFATIFFWIIFPFDLLLANLLLLQLPFVITKQTTLHAFLSGNNRTIKASP